MTSLVERALAAEVPEGVDHILDAALALVGASGLRNLTMDDVARRAGVGRMTVYRRFGTREALVDALMGREAQRCLAEMYAASPLDAPVEDQVAAGFATAIRLSREHPLLSRLARTEPDAVLNAFANEGLMELCVAFLGERGVAPDVAEILTRVAVSFVVLPESALDLDDPDLGRRLLAPLLV